MTSLSIQQKADLITAQFDDANLSFGQGLDNAWDESVWLILKAIDFPMDSQVVDWERGLDDAEIVKIDTLVERRIESRLPLAYLLKETWFAGFEFYIDQRALIPRSFFGEWIPEQFEPWIDASKVNSILDLCTGSGCIAIACAHYFEEAQVTGSDISDDALAVAKINVEKHGLEDRVKLNCGDLFDGIQGRYDLIVCNPPYVSNARMELLTEEFLYEPDNALRAGDDGLDFIERLLVTVREYLSDNGTLLVEAGSASFALEEKYPHVPFVWLSTEHDETVVFMITSLEIDRYFSR